MIKFRWYYDKDKEEDFLNQMASKGYAMTKFFLGIYWFNECKPNEYTYRVDLLSGKNYEQKSDYIQLVKEAGGEYVQKWGPWVFFRKKGEFELYTDIESQIEFYSRIKKMFLFLAIFELVTVIYEFILYIFSPDEINGNIYLAFMVILGAIASVFIYQVSKCNKKIKSIKEDI